MEDLLISTQLFLVLTSDTTFDLMFLSWHNRSSSPCISKSHKHLILSPPFKSYCYHIFSGLCCNCLDYYNNLIISPPVFSVYYFCCVFCCGGFVESFLLSVSLLPTKHNLLACETWVSSYCVYIAGKTYPSCLQGPLQYIRNLHLRLFLLQLLLCEPPSSAKLFVLQKDVDCFYFWIFLQVLLSVWNVFTLLENYWSVLWSHLKMEVFVIFP